MTIWSPIVRGMDDEVFRALADANRRTLLDRLFERDGQTLGELEAALPGMTRFGVMKHLRVLEAAGLVTSRKVGRERHHYLNPVPIRRIHDRWLDRYRIRAADLLDDLRIALETPMTAQGADVGRLPRATSFTTYIRSTPERIWQALTDSSFTLRYYYNSTVALATGPSAARTSTGRGRPGDRGRGPRGRPAPPARAIVQRPVVRGRPRRRAVDDDLRDRGRRTRRLEADRDPRGPRGPRRDPRRGGRRLAVDRGGPQDPARDRRAAA